MEHYNVVTYKFKKPPNAYNRKENLTEDCHKGDPVLLSGLSDVSKCYNGELHNFSKIIRFIKHYFISQESVWLLPIPILQTVIPNYKNMSTG